MYLVKPVYYMTEKKEPQTQEEIGKVREWLSKEDPISIFTHQKVDADAAFSAALLKVLRPQAAIKFVRADSIIADERSIAVDLSEGSRAVKGLGVGSAFGLIVEVMKEIDRPVYNALRNWAKQLNLTDSGKYTRDGVVLADIVNAWLSLNFNDLKIVSRAEEMIKGKILSAKRNHEQKKAADTIIIKEGIALVPKGINVKAGHLFKRGAKAVIRQSKFGQSVMISKKLLKKGISFTEIISLLPNGWFVHPQGFLAAFGTVKAPKDYKKSGIHINDLVTIIKTWIKSHENADQFTKGILARSALFNSPN